MPRGVEGAIFSAQIVTPCGLVTRFGRLDPPKNSFDMLKKVLALNRLFGGASLLPFPAFWWS